MKHFIQFRSGLYFFNAKCTDLFEGPYSTLNLLDATMFDDISVAKKLSGSFMLGTKVISISAKDLFKLKLGAR